MSAGQQVLLIEDEPDLIAIVSETLRDEGYDVVAVNDGRAGLERARTNPPGLILLDLWMPGMSGREFLRVYGELPAPRAPVILVTASATQDGDVDVVGADAVLAKPFDLDELVNVVAQYLARPHSTLAVSTSASPSPVG